MAMRPIRSGLSINTWRSNRRKAALRLAEAGEPGGANGAGLDDGPTEEGE